MAMNGCFVGSKDSEQKKYPILKALNFKLWAHSTRKRQGVGQVCSLLCHEVESDRESNVGLVGESNWKARLSPETHHKGSTTDSRYERPNRGSSSDVTESRRKSHLTKESCSGFQQGFEEERGGLSGHSCWRIPSLVLESRSMLGLKDDMLLFAKKIQRIRERKWVACQLSLESAKARLKLLNEKNRRNNRHSEEAEAQRMKAVLEVEKARKKAKLKLAMLRLQLSAQSSEICSARQAASAAHRERTLGVINSEQGSGDEGSANNPCDLEREWALNSILELEEARLCRRNSRRLVFAMGQRELCERMQVLAGQCQQANDICHQPELDRAFKAMVIESQYEALHEKGLTPESKKTRALEETELQNNCSQEEISVSSVSDRTVDYENSSKEKNSMSSDSSVSDETVDYERCGFNFEGPLLLEELQSSEYSTLTGGLIHPHLFSPVTPPSELLCELFDEFQLEERSGQIEFGDASFSRYFFP